MIATGTVLKQTHTGHKSGSNMSNNNNILNNLQQLATVWPNEMSTDSILLISNQIRAKEIPQVQSECIIFIYADKQL